MEFTAGFLEKIPYVYTHPMDTIYLSLSAQVAEGTGNGRYFTKKQKHV